MALATALLAAAGAACSTVSLRTPEARRQFAGAVIENWSGYSRLQAEKLIQEYGPPDRVKHDELAWQDKGLWRRIRVWDVTPYFDSNVGAPDLEQTISYPVLPAQSAALAALGDKLSVSSDQKELSARGASEEENLLALNLADEIIAGRRTAQDARRLYDTTIELSQAGKSSPYTQRLLFTPPAAPSPR
jgi:hypothetical protein